MRQIKFRAYDKEKKVMIYDHDQVVADIYDLPLGSYIPMTVRVIGEINETYMQFTGLHDRNGKEIYEGDLIKLHDYFITEVFFNDGGFFCNIHNNNGIFEDILCNSNSICEVIGSIHENPELLESK